MAELVDVCDENNELTGEKVTKKQAHENGLWHRAAHIWIYNSKGEVLVQLRSKIINLCPNMWDTSVAGHVSSGEEPITSALREIKEEIGLEVKKDDLEFVKVRKYKGVLNEIKNNEIDYVYFLKFDGNASKLVLQKEEVQKTTFRDVEELKEDLEKNPDKFVPHGNYWFEIIAEIKKRTKK